MEHQDILQIGLGLTGFGVLFSFLGIIFFFDRGLLAMGNILFLSGLMLTIGLKSTLQFFTKRRNYKGTISFVAGFFLVLIGWAFCGMILEAYGFIVLFRSGNLQFVRFVVKLKASYMAQLLQISSNTSYIRYLLVKIVRILTTSLHGACSGFWPTLSVFLQRIPIVGWIFRQPFFTSLFDRQRGKRVPV